MKQEQKELLLKDLCARLPYGVKVQTTYISPQTKERTDIGTDVLSTVEISMLIEGYEEHKPYLFPLSSMTEEQKIIYGDLCYAIIHSLAWDMQAALNELVDWLNENHFDYNNLIPMGLSLDATGLNIYQNYGIYTTLFYKKEYS